MVGEDQRVEAVFVVGRALYPRSTSNAVAIADLGDRQVEVVLGHLLVSVVWLVNRFRVNTHEPCGLNRIKPDSKGIRILFFGAYLRAEMLGELCGWLAHQPVRRRSVSWSPGRKRRGPASLQLLRTGR